MDVLPHVTFVLLAYNQEAFIADALRGALNQTYENLEILVYDDASQDKTRERILHTLSATDSPHTVRVQFNRTNRGLTAQVNTAFENASGELIVLAGGDDFSMAHRVSHSVSQLMRVPGAAAISTGQVHMGVDGKELRPFASVPASKADLIGLETYLGGRGIGLSGASRTYRRSVFDEFGPINEACPTEDTPLLFRSLYLGGILSDPRKCLQYRLHPDNLSSKKGLEKMDLSEIREQYRRDLGVAGTKEFVTPAQAERTMAWIQYNYAARLFRRELSQGVLGYVSALRKFSLYSDCEPHMKVRVVVGESKRALRNRLVVARHEWRSKKPVL